MENFKGQIVNVTQGEIEKTEAQYYHHGLTQIEPYALLNRSKDLKKREMMGLEGELAEMVFPGLDVKIQALRQEHGDEVVDTILEGKLRVSFLINCTGGVQYSADHRKEINRMLRQKESEIDTYLRYAYGPSAEIFLQSKNRIITSDALLCPTIYKDGTPDFNEERNDDLIWSLTSKVPRELSAEFSDRIREALEALPDDNALVFNAAEMERYGIATKVVLTPADLQAEFEKRTGITLLPDNLSSPFEQKVKAFFE